MKVTGSEKSLSQRQRDNSRCMNNSRKTWLLKMQAAAQGRHVELALDGLCLVEGKIRLIKENKAKMVDGQNKQIIYV